MSDLFNLLIIVVPIALVAAISPTTFIVMIVLLSLSKKPKISGLGFFVGSLIIILIAVLLGFVAGEGATLVSTDINLIPGWINLIIGPIMLYFGLKMVFKKDYGADEEQVENRLKDKCPDLGFNDTVILSMGLFSLNLITTILVFSASSQIALSSVNWVGKIISTVLLAIITLLIVEIPLIIVFLVPKKADDILLKLNRWIQKRGHYLTAGLIIIIGAYILFNGLKELNLI